MRTALLCVLLTACESQTAKTALDRTGGLDNRVDVLERDLAALRAQLGAMDDRHGSILLARLDERDAEIAALRERMAAMEAASKPKQLHLIVRETGDDLGVSVDGALAAWNEEHQVVVDYAQPPDVHFDQPGCAGRMYIDSRQFDANTKIARYNFTGDGRLFKIVSLAWQGSGSDNGSILYPNGQCSPTRTVQSGVTAILAPFAVPRVAPELLSLQMR